MNRIGYKKDLFATIINQLWRIITGPLILLFIPIYLTPLEQGYWYTFTSLAALAIFADLGFSIIILQFAAHEFAFLRFDNNHIIFGDKEHLWKLASFFRFSVCWLGRIIAIIFPLIVIFGYYFLTIKTNNVNWQGAWLIYSIASGIVFFNSAIMCFFEGCNSVALLQTIRFYIAIGTSISTLICLYSHFNLYALAVSLLVNATLGSGFLIKYFSKTIKQLWVLSRKDVFQWWPEFSALIWRYAISWCSGYFIFQLFTPLAFKYHGAVFAGQIGISIAMWTAGFNISTSWLTAITPQLNMLIEKHEWNSLDKIFNKNLLYTMSTMLFGGIVFFIFYICLQNRFFFFKRILDIESMLLLFVCWIGQTYVNSIAVYLRAHKKEPLMLVSLFSAIYISISTFLCARFLSERFLFLGFLTSFVFVIPVVRYIFIKQKRIHEL